MLLALMIMGIDSFAKRITTPADMNDRHLDWRGIFRKSALFPGNAAPTMASALVSLLAALSVGLFTMTPI